MNSVQFLSSTLPLGGLQHQGEPDRTSTAFKLQLYNLDPWSFQDGLPLEIVANDRFKDSPCRPGEAMQFFPLTDFQQSPFTNTSHQELVVCASESQYSPHPYPSTPPRAIQYWQAIPQTVNAIANDGNHETRQQVSADPDTLAGTPSSQHPDFVPLFGRQYIQTLPPPNRQFAQTPIIPPYIHPTSALPLSYPRAKRNIATSNSYHQGVTLQSFESSQAIQPGLTTKSDVYIGTAQVAGYEPSMRLET